MQPSSWPWESCVRRGCLGAWCLPDPKSFSPLPGLTSHPGPKSQILVQIQEPSLTVVGVVTMNAAALFPRSPRAGSLRLSLPRGENLRVNATPPFQRRIVWDAADS